MAAASVSSTSSLCPRMRRLVNRLESFFAHVSVQLGRSQIGVPEQLLHGPQVGPTVEEMGGEGVAQGVRVGRAGRPPVEYAAHVTGRGWPAPPVREPGVRR